MTFAHPHPQDAPQPVSTYELLTAIEEHGPRWPAALSGYGLDTVGDAISREILAGNLRDGANLTEQGRRLLIDIRARRRLG